MNLDLEPIKEAVAKATPGPWVVGGNVDGREVTVWVGPPWSWEDTSGHYIVPADDMYSDADRPQRPEDAQFIADARRWIPLLIEEVEELRSQLDTYRTTLEQLP